jgi:hypothetical protein
MTEIVQIKTFPLAIESPILKEIQNLMEIHTLNKVSTVKMFKNSKKLECSQFIWENINSREELVRLTIFYENNNIYINYPIFKLFIIPDIYDTIINYIINVIVEVINQNGKYNIHINIDSFTISAAERYMVFINSIFERVFRTQYVNHLEKIYIYNAPSVIEFLKNIFNGLLRGNNMLKDKIVVIGKNA